MLYQTAHFADGVIQFTLSLCKLHPLLHLEHNPINQAALKETSRVLLATITFIGQDTNASAPFLKELVHNPQACQFSAKATDGAVVWSWKAHIQEEEFAEEEGVVDPFFDFVITQAVPGLKQ